MAEHATEDLGKDEHFLLIGLATMGISVEASKTQTEPKIRTTIGLSYASLGISQRTRSPALGTPSYPHLVLLCSQFQRTDVV